ncbi:hypothetical protein [Pseudomonas sp. AMR01]|uniref:hypothetical protein n=1 Tax=Pseudomonas sp. AMR01 TaxID=3064904 RepID=UPI0035BFE7C4
MQTLIRVATEDDVDSLFAIRTAVQQNHLSREQLAEMGITSAAFSGWALAGPVDGEDVRYQKIKAH